MSCLDSLEVQERRAAFEHNGELNVYIGFELLVLLGVTLLKLLDGVGVFGPRLF